MSNPSMIRPKIGARASALAQIQIQRVADRLGVEAQHVGYTTKGDLIQHKHLRDLGGKELFVRDVAQALLKGAIDLAVHSLKDMPAQQPEGIIIAAILPREDMRDALVSRDGYADLHALPEGIKIGTASPRRTAQIKSHRPDLQPILLRGNVDTRLRKIASGEYDAARLAMSGLARLGRTEMAVPIDTHHILPAAAQGVICVECREDDERMRQLCSQAHHPETEQCVLAERGFTSAFGASCYIPVAALAERKEDEIVLRAQLLTLDGSENFYDERRGINPQQLGKDSARHIASLAGEELLHAIGAELQL